MLLLLLYFTGIVFWRSLQNRPDPWWSL